MKIAGIDAGVNGSAALLDTADSSLNLYDLQLLDDRSLDAHWLFQLLLDWEPAMVVTEATFRVESLLRMTGEISAIAKILQTDLRVVPVVTWKKALLGTNTKDKAVSIACCKKLHPDAPLRRNPRCRTDSPDRAEAVLLAVYGSRLR